MAVKRDVMPAFDLYQAGSVAQGSNLEAQSDATDMPHLLSNHSGT